MEKLLKEERLIMRCLSLYGCLKKEQLIKLVANKGEAKTKIYEGLKKRGYVEEFDGNYVRLDPKTNADERTISAFWVLLDYIKKIDPNAHYRADYPSEIFFMRENMMYEIISIFSGEEYLLKSLFLENRYNSQEEQDRMKFIVIVQSPDSIEACISSIPSTIIENGQVVFAVLEYPDGSDEPKVEYYKC